MNIIIIPDNIPALPKQYKKLLSKIKDKLPAIQKDQQAFFKTQTQFMDNMLTVSHPTPIRNLRQISAEINKSKLALEQAFFKNKKRSIRIKQKEQKSQETTDPLDLELLQIQIQETQCNIDATTDYMQGAIRKISAYMEQYNSILKSINKESITEEDLEKEESRYHVGKAFEQALIAARSRSGIIDEGNLIYFQQIGINGAVAQMEVVNYLHLENELFEDNKAPTHEMTLRWLNAMMDKYQQEPMVYAQKKGMNLLDKESLINLEDK